MNAEVIKAMNKKEKKQSIRKWWNKNGYKVMRVILFPLWIYTIVYEKIQDWIISRISWSEERADEILSYYVPRYASWHNDDQSFYFFDNGYGWSMNLAKKFLKWRDRKFWKMYACGFGGKIRTYLIDKFELEGFTKEVGNCYDGWTEITFKIRG